VRAVERDLPVENFLSRELRTPVAKVLAFTVRTDADEVVVVHRALGCSPDSDDILPARTSLSALPPGIDRLQNADAPGHLLLGDS
jgi:hypothetical protein